MEQRFDPNTYADDPLIGVALADGEDTVWVPDRLWARLCWLGSAYQLHHLPMLHEGRSAHRLNVQQAAILGDELQVLTQCITDEATLEQIQRLLPIVARASRPRSAGLVIE